MNALRRLIKSTGLVLLMTSAPMLYAEAPLEHKVKTAFIYNFAKFVKWPESLSSTGEFTICVSGRTPVGSLIQETLEGKTVRDQQIVVRNLAGDTRSLKDCHMLYLNGSDSSVNSRLLASARNTPILTIGESSEFSRQGGIIQFVLMDGKIRFHINKEVAQTTGLQISAKLLEVAVKTQDYQSSRGLNEAPARHARL